MDEGGEKKHNFPGSLLLCTLKIKQKRKFLLFFLFFFVVGFSGIYLHSSPSV